MNQKILEKLKNQAFQTYYSYLIEENNKINLTAITDREDVYAKHFYDSLMISEYINFDNKKVLDIGAGAGFPSIPILLTQEHMDLTIVDGLKKRIEFLDRLSDKLNIKVQLIHGRAEELALFNHFDIVLARAVAKLNILIEMALPLLKINAYFVAFKSIHYQEELDQSIKAIDLLGGKLEKIIQYPVNPTLDHVYIIIKKIKKSPKGYPRPYAKIKKSPL
jgi:16S rRNA (guanine527-N7)-methyltransferase